MTRTVLRRCAYVATVDADDTVLRDVDIEIEDGRIAAIGPDLPAGSPTRPATVIDARRRLVLPGLVNLHTHAAMTLLRGIAEDVDLAGFLRRVFAAEGAVMDADTVRLGTELGALEALRGGTTMLADMYLHPLAGRSGAARLGARLATGPVFFDGPGPDGLNWDDRMAAAETWPRDARAVSGPAAPDLACPHSTYLVSPAHLAGIRQVVAGWDSPVIHTHVSETADENAQVRAATGGSPVAALTASGLLDGSLPVIYGHGVHLDDDDLAATVRAGATIAHCPGSNLKLASGALPWHRYRRAGARIGLGTDGCSSSNDLDMWTAMRLAALLARLTSQAPDAVASRDIVRAATIDGARALGMGDVLGSVETGKQADLVLLDLDAPHLTPVHDVAALLVFAAGRGDVSDVFVAGERVVADRRSTRVDEEELLARAHATGRAVAAAVADAGGTA